MNQAFEKAITDALTYLDDSIAGGESVLAEQPNPVIRQLYAANLGVIKGIRAALLEAFDEQKAEERRKLREGEP